MSVYRTIGPLFFILSLWNWKTSKEGKDGNVGVGLIILYMPSDNCNKAHATELLCVTIGNFRFSNNHQSEEHEMASFKVKVMCHRLITCVRRSQDRPTRPKHILPQTCRCYVDPHLPHFY